MHVPEMRWTTAVLALVSSACGTKVHFQPQIVLLDEAPGIQRISTAERHWGSCDTPGNPHAYRIERPDYTLVIAHSDQRYVTAQLALIATSSAGQPLEIRGHAVISPEPPSARDGLSVLPGTGMAPWRSLRAIGVNAPTHFIWLPAAPHVDSRGTLNLDIGVEGLMHHEDIGFRSTWPECVISEFP